MPQLTRNTQAGPLVYADPETRRALEWAGRGDAGAADYIYVSDAIMETPTFMRVVDKGLVELVSTEQVAEVRAKQAEHLRAQNEAHQKQDQFVEHQVERSVSKETGLSVPFETEDMIDGKAQEGSLKVIVDHQKA